MSTEPAPKRIIICCDGTWMSAVSGERGSPSNISRLCRSLARAGIDAQGKTWQQIVWYDSGVGTTSGKLGKVVEGATGEGLEGNVIEAYNFIALNYVAGDQIFCFGYSRGAYTARAIAGLISDIGICEPSKMNDFPDIWAVYKKMDKKRFYGSDEYFEFVDGIPAPPEEQPADLGHENRNLIWNKPARGEWAVTAESREVEVVGVFDTVGAIGVPSIRGIEPKLPHQYLGIGGKPDLAFHNVRLNRNIKHAFHALALDERREAFTPTLFAFPEGEEATDSAIAAQEQAVQVAGSEYFKIRVDKKVRKEARLAAHRKYNEARLALINMRESKKKQSDLLQVWFPGTHGNVGGGNSDTLEDEGDMEEIAFITFAWLLEQIRPYLAINERTVRQEYLKQLDSIDDLDETISKFKEEQKADHPARATELWTSFAKRATSTAVANITDRAGPDLRRRDYGWGTGTIIDSFTPLYMINGAQARTPGGYAQHRKHSVLGVTNEFVHPTVGYRMTVTKNDKDEKLRYKPIGMNTSKFFRRSNAAGEWEYSVNGIILPEYKIGTNFEYLPVRGEQARKYATELRGKS